MTERSPRQKDEAHCKFIRGLPCIICGDNVSVECCHIRYSTPGKPNAGVGAKPDDKFTLPLCGNHHRAQHAGSERKFWQALELDPIKIALELYLVSGNHEKGCEIIEKAGKPVSILQAG